MHRRRATPTATEAESATAQGTAAVRAATWNAVAPDPHADPRAPTPGTRPRHPCAVERSTISPMSTPSGCSIA